MIITYQHNYSNSSVTVGDDDYFAWMILHCTILYTILYYNREINTAAVDRINSAREQCLFEREDMHSHFMRGVEQWMSNNIISFELYEVEIKRMHEEGVRLKAQLLKRDLEVEYLQSQLKIAAQVIATYSRRTTIIESASDWDESCV